MFFKKLKNFLKQGFENTIVVTDHFYKFRTKSQSTLNDYVNVKKVYQDDIEFKTAEYTQYSENRERRHTRIL